MAGFAGHGRFGERMNSYRRWLPAIALVVLSLTWGYTWVLAKQGLQYARRSPSPPSVAWAGRCRCSSSR